MVYDSIDTLLACGIKIVDATEFRGVWHRLPKPLTAKELDIKVPESLIVKVIPATVVKVVKGIRVTDARPNQKMNY